MRWMIPLFGIIAMMVFSIPILEKFQQGLAPGGATGATSTAASRASTRPSKQAAKVDTVRIPTSAQVYRWRDASGTLHIESAPPPSSMGAEKLILRGQKKVKVPSAAPAQSGQGSGVARQRLLTPQDLPTPASIYAPGGTERLMQQLDQTLGSMRERRAVLDEIKKDL